MKYKAIVGLIFFVIFSGSSSCAIKSCLCSPYFASIKSNRVNAHVGPGKNYKITCEYIASGVPVVITAKYDHWRRIKDPDGVECWIHKSMLSPKRFVISISKTPIPLKEKTNDGSKVIAKIKQNVIMRLLSVRGNWCEVEAIYKNKKYKGWIQKNTVFGVSNNEIW